MKRIFSLILVVALLVSPLASLTRADGEGGYEPDITEEYSPQLVVEDSLVPVAKAGQDYSFNFRIKNVGDPVDSLTVSPEFSGEASPFYSKGGGQTQSIDRVSSSGQDVRMTFGVTDHAKEGVYPIKLNFNYRYTKSISGSRRPVYASGDFSHTVNVRVVNENKGPQLFVMETSTSPDELTPGSTAKLRIGFQNKGSIVAKDLAISLEGLNASEGFYIDKGSDKTFVDKVLGNDQANISYNIRSSKSIAPGGHELIVKFKYKFGDEMVEDSQKIYLNIGAKNGKNAKLAIEGLNFPTGPIKPGASYPLSFNLRNKGELDARNIIVKLDAGEGVVPTSQNIKKINSLAPGKGQTMSFSFSPSPDAQTRNYPINITVEYEDQVNKNSENKYVITDFAGIYAYNPPKPEPKPKEPKPPKEPAPEHKPKLIIDKYSFSPQLVQAGENFTMNLSFYNTNGDKAVKNIKIFLTSDEKTEEDTGGGGNSVFTPVETSNTFYIENIPPKGRVEKSIKMFTVPDAKAKTYTIVANFEYEDSKAKEFTATELIGVPVVQKSRLDIGQVNIQDEFYQGEPGSVNLEFYNTGKVTLYNLMVRVEGKFQKENGTQFVGNFEPGNSETFDATIIPDQLGDLEGEIVFTYEDSTGQPIEHREKFSGRVVEGMMEEDDMGEDFPEENKSKKWKVLGGILAGLALGLAGLKIYKKKKSQKELDELDDWEDDGPDQEGRDEDEY